MLLKEIHMLEVRNVTKIYREKGGSETAALCDVNIMFPEKGLVFLLGKSGSGKSTLLNIIGGLDAPTEGEVIVMGKSSKTFSNGDFDSYRNTFIGFVFQEYNLLNEFSVEENVALALELKRQKGGREKVAEILREVDLADFAKRRPGNLSGGQRQRVAIARALVKDPKIILADEPTGALDSETGAQIFSLLKHFSEDRLVIVVSHDRESAEMYGDRIVELRDGRVVSDLTRNGEGFAETTPPKPYQGEEAKLIRSRLPLAHMIKMGVSPLKTKPFRLALTLLLCIFSFTVFGLFSTLLFFDRDVVLRHSLTNTEFEYAHLSKAFKSLEHENEFDRDANFTPNEIASFGEGAFGAYHAYLECTNLDCNGQDYYDAVISTIAVLKEGDALHDSIKGTYPVAQNEIAVSSFFFESAKNCIWNTVDERGELGAPKKIEREEDLIGEYFLTWDQKLFKITGIFDCGPLPAYYDPVRTNVFKNDDEKYNLQDEWNSYRNESILHLALVSPAMTSQMGYGSLPLALTENIYTAKTFLDGQEDNADSYELFNAGIYDGESENMNPVLLFHPVKKLADNETIIPADMFILMLSERNRLKNPSGYYAEPLREKYDSDELFEEAHAEWERHMQLYHEFCEMNVTISELSDLLTEILRGYCIIDGKPVTLTYLEIEARKEELCEKLKPLVFPITLYDDGAPLGEFNVVGVLLSDRRLAGLYLSENNFANARRIPIHGSGMDYNGSTKYFREEDAIYSVAIVPFASNSKQVDKVLSMIDRVDEKTDVVYHLNCHLKSRIEYICDTVFFLLDDILMYVGIAFTVFAALMLFHFITISTQSKRKEIGILRAIGARRADVFGIFFVESLLIVAICLIFSIAATAVLAHVVSGILWSRAALLLFRAPSFFTMVALALGVGTLATFLPVYLAAKKKPAESIRAL